MENNPEQNRKSTQDKITEFKKTETKIRITIVLLIFFIILLIVLLVLFKSQIWMIVSNFAVVVGLIVNIIKLIEKLKELK